MSAISSANITSLYIGSKCQVAWGGCAHVCKITLEDGRSIGIGVMKGINICALLREIGEGVLDGTKWDSCDALKKHFFDQFKGALPDTKVLLNDLFSMPTMASKDDA